MRHAITLSTTLLCAAHASHATDRVVSSSGTYNTISSAIAASSDGDRVLVEPGVYNEELFITRSISIHPTQEGGRYTVTNRVFTLGASGKTITLSGARILQGLRASGSFAEPTQVRVYDSYLEDCQASGTNIRVELYRDTVQMCVYLSAGSVVGCTILNQQAGQGIALSGTNTFGEPVRIIGNRIGSPSATNAIGMHIDAIGTFHVENNFIALYTNHIAVQILHSADINTPRSTIINNTFYKSASTGLTAVSNALEYFNVEVRNNAAIGYGVVHDIAPYYGGTIDESHNLLAAPSWIDTSTGGPSIGSPLIDAGDPSPRYLDLDLSVNDVGCFGGSNSRANFTTLMGSAVVGFMNAPRVVSQGDAVNISATGFDR